MITATSAFNTANASRLKKPCYIVEIGTYKRAFTNCPGFAGEVVDGFGGADVTLQRASQLNDYGGLELFGGTVTLPYAVDAGNILFAFAYWGDGGTDPSVSDTAGNTWIPIYDDISGGVAGWYAIALASVAGNEVTFETGSNRANSEFYVIEVSGDYQDTLAVGGDTQTGTSFSFTVGSFTYAFTKAITNTAWLVLVELLPPTDSSWGIHIVFGRTSDNVALPSSTSIIDGASPNAVVLVTGPATVYDWITVLDDLKETINDLEGGASLSDFVFHVQDRLSAGVRQLTADCAGMTFEGKQVRLRAGFAGMSTDDFVTLFVGVIDFVENDNANLEYVFTCPDARRDMSKNIYTIGDDGFPTSEDHPHTINAHPLDILSNILDTQLAMPSSQIDTTVIAEYRNGLLAGLGNFKFTITEPPVAKDFVQNELMKQLGGYTRTNNLGQVTVVFLYLKTVTPVFDFDEDNVIGIPTYEQADLINETSYKFDNDGNDFFAVAINRDRASVAKYAQTGTQEIESMGVRSGFQGFVLANFVSFLIFLRYAYKALMIEDLNAIWTACLLEAGDLVTLTHSKIPDRVGGVLGITDKVFVVTDRKWALLACKVTYKVTEVDIEKYRRFVITGNAEADYPAAGADQATKMFLSNNDDEYSTADPGNTMA